MKTNLLKKEKNNTSTSSLSAGRGSILPLKHKGSQRGFEQNPSYTFPYALREGQTGRSMVEMLGVLAVMGVLSVAGIAGYNNAMNKHRANELLNEASKRATVVAMQMASGRGANIDEFKVNGTQAFTVSGNAGDTTFTLTIGNVDEAVCKQIVNSAGTTGMIRKITSGGTDTAGDASKCTSGALVLTYNADLSNKDIPSGVADEEAAECNGHGYKDSNDACVCAAGYSGTDCSSTLCASGKTYCGDNSGTPICCDNATEVCPTGGTSSGTCFKAATGCTTNANCTNPDKPWCNLGANDCEIPSAGTCTELDAGTPSTEVKDGDGKTVFKAGQFLIGPKMNWFAAQNWCRAHGKELVHLSTFKISTSVNDERWCDLPCGSSESCDYQNNYDGTSDTASAVCKPLGSSSIMDINDAYYGKLLGYMRAAIGSDYYWTADDYSSCNAFRVYLDSGNVSDGTLGTRTDNDYALCE